MSPSIGGDRDVVEQAEAHRVVPAGVMSRRSHRAEAGAGLAAHQRPHHFAGAAGGVQRRLVGGLADERVRVDLAASSGAQVPDPHGWRK
jgi:hypothetical protein